MKRARIAIVLLLGILVVSGLVCGGENMDIIGIVVPIVVAALLGWFLYCRTNKALLAIFELVTALPGGQEAKRIYDDKLRIGHVRGVPYLTKEGEWRIYWRIPPPIPHAFYGAVIIGGQPVPVGTVILAKVNGVESGSVTTWEVGRYGWGIGSPPEEYQGNLLVQGEHISSGDEIEFYINGVKADQTHDGFQSGELTELDLTVV